MTALSTIAGYLAVLLLGCLIGFVAGRVTGDRQPKWQRDAALEDPELNSPNHRGATVARRAWSNP